MCGVVYVRWRKTQWLVSARSVWCWAGSDTVFAVVTSDCVSLYRSMLLTQNDKDCCNPTLSRTDLIKQSTTINYSHGDDQTTHELSGLASRQHSCSLFRVGEHHTPFSHHSLSYPPPSFPCTASRLSLLLTAVCGLCASCRRPVAAPRCRAASARPARTPRPRAARRRRPARRACC